MVPVARAVPPAVLREWAERVWQAPAAGGADLPTATVRTAARRAPASVDAPDGRGLDSGGEPATPRRVERGRTQASLWRAASGDEPGAARRVAHDHGPPRIRRAAADDGPAAARHEVLADAPAILRRMARAVESIEATEGRLVEIAGGASAEVRWLADDELAGGLQRVLERQARARGIDLS